jgi:hypothetical protein
MVVQVWACNNHITITSLSALLPTARRGTEARPRLANDKHRRDAAMSRHTTSRRFTSPHAASHHPTPRHTPTHHTPARHPTPRHTPTHHTPTRHPTPPHTPTHHTPRHTPTGPNTHLRGQRADHQEGQRDKLAQARQAAKLVVDRARLRRNTAPGSKCCCVARLLLCGYSFVCYVRATFARCARRGGGRSLRVVAAWREVAAPDIGGPRSRDA